MYIDWMIFSFMIKKSRCLQNLTHTKNPLSRITEIRGFFKMSPPGFEPGTPRLKV